MNKVILFSCLASLCVVLGCGGGAVGNTDRPETAPVSVTITYKSAAVEGATVTFSPKDTQNGKAAYGTTDKSGTVTLNAFPDVEGVVPGDYHVLVAKMEVVKDQAVSMDDPNYDGEPKETPKAPPKSLVPEKYKAAATSTLEASVKGGEDNTFTFDLVD